MRLLFVSSYPNDDFPANATGTPVNAPVLEYGIYKNPSLAVSNKIFPTPIIVFISVASKIPVVI